MSRSPPTSTLFDERLSMISEQFVVLSAWQQLLVVLLAAVITATLVNVTISTLVRRAARRSDKSGYEVILGELHVPLYATVVLGAVYLSASLVAELPTPIDRLSQLATLLALSGITVAWTYASIRVGRKALELGHDSGIRYELAPILKNFWTFGVLLAAVLTLIGIWGIDLTPILAAGGILGIVIGIAARDTIANFIGGVSLFFDNTYKLGDFVLLETGEKGTVVDIGIRSTTLLTRDYVLVTVPNSVLNNAQVINQSAPSRRMRIRIDVRVPYDADLDTVEACMFEATRNANTVLESPPPEVRIQQYADRGIEYELRCFVPNPIQQVRGRHEVYRELATAFEREGIKAPYVGRELRHAADRGTLRFDDGHDGLGGPRRSEDRSTGHDSSKSER